MWPCRVRGRVPAQRHPQGSLFTECPLGARSFAGTFFAWSSYVLIRTGLSDVVLSSPRPQGELRLMCLITPLRPPTLQAVELAQTQSRFLPVSEPENRHIGCWAQAGRRPVRSQSLPHTGLCSHPLSHGFPLLSPWGHPERSSPSIFCPSPHTGQGLIPTTVEAG